MLEVQIVDQCTAESGIFPGRIASVLRRHVSLTLGMSSGSWETYSEWELIVEAKESSQWESILWCRFL